jgi:hypothetical protein
MDPWANPDAEPTAGAKLIVNSGEYIARYGLLELYAIDWADERARSTAIAEVLFRHACNCIHLGLPLDLLGTGLVSVCLAQQTISVLQPDRTRMMSQFNPRVRSHPHIVRRYAAKPREIDKKKLQKSVWGAK